MGLWESSEFETEKGYETILRTAASNYKYRHDDYGFYELITFLSVYFVLIFMLTIFIEFTALMERERK